MKMALTHSSFCLLVLAAMSSAQTTVGLSGTVKNSRTATPITGATVTLVGLPLHADTDTGGRFSLSGASALFGPLNRGEGLPAMGSESIHYRHESAGQALIRVFDLFGHQRAVVFSGLLGAGNWRFPAPALAPGIYICAFDTPQGRQSIRWLGSMAAHAGPANTLPALPVAAYPFQSGAAKISLADAVDTLVVAKSGYRPARVPVTSYQQTGMNILLEDTAAAVADNATLVPDPSWTCFMPEGIPPPSLGEAAFTLTLQIGAIHNVGLTKFGQRRQYDIKGGTIAGTRIDGAALTGGLDYELTLSNGSTELEQIVILKAKNIPILMRNAGIAPIGGKNVRVVLDFEAPNTSEFTWLNTGKFAATRIVDTVAKTIRMEVFDISKTALTTTRVQLKDPTDAINQTWDCFKLTGGQGTTVFTENVTLGASVSIGASKRGSRNIIPITGGTTTGRVAGKILDGGADYQLGGLDARYTLAPSDGEFIIVRNCGSNGLVPVFEARVAGPYNFLNENKYLSSQPGTGGGGVSITFYELK